MDTGLLEERLAQGSFLHARLSQSANELWGLDIDENGIRRLRDVGYANMHVGSAEAPPNGIPRGYFDVIIAGEIIEHVRNVGLLLESAGDLLTATGCIVITTPNALRFYNSLPALFRKELVHPDHLSWFSPYTLSRSIEAGPFQLEQINVYSNSPSPNLRGAKNPLDWIVRALSKCLIPPLHGTVNYLFPYLSDGLIAVGRRWKSPE